MLYVSRLSLLCLQGFNAVGWAAGRASSLYKTEWLDAGMVICLGRGAGLHMAQLMPLPLTVSGWFWYRLTWIIPEQSPEGRKTDVCVCVCVCACVHACVSVCICHCCSVYFVQTEQGFLFSYLTNMSGGMLAWLSGMRYRLAYSPADATATLYLLLQ